MSITQLMETFVRLFLSGFAALVMAGSFAACDAPEPAPTPTAATDDSPIAATEVLASPSSTDATQLGEAYTIVMLGDSLTAGFGLPPSDALPAEIERLLQSDARPVKLINAGVSGDTSAGGLARYDWSVASANPDLLVIALGANDYLTGLDPDQTRANLSAIIDRAMADNLDILLVSVSARSSSEDDPRATDFATIYPDLAETYDVPLYEGLVEPIFDQPTLLMPDGLHPTAEGVRVMAAPLAQALSELVTDE